MPSDPVDTSDLFQCTMCGECCKGFGGTYVSSEDVAAIADHIGETPEAFLRKFTMKSGSRRVIAQREDGFCVFMDNGCAIHPVKPEMCRQWPFIRSILTDVINWKTMAVFCPGMKEDADENLIIRCVKKELERSKK